MSTAVPSFSSSGAGTLSGTGATVRTTYILLNPSPISLEILPVRISAKGGKRLVEGYAFLDNGSTGNVFLESLVDQLDANATLTILNCERMRNLRSENRIS
jgi:hypothetical protein